MLSYELLGLFVGIILACLSFLDRAVFFKHLPPLVLYFYLVNLADHLVQLVLHLADLEVMFLHNQLVALLRLEPSSESSFALVDEGFPLLLINWAIVVLNLLVVLLLVYFLLL